ncbi:MAG TPA: hypothetical protein VEH27_00710 [Methylomirabilota bacterium]|nr:hypothetical protein [Methylomirabilota bacterium]
MITFLLGMLCGVAASVAAALALLFWLSNTSIEERDYWRAQGE